ncbi:MAG TPA: hypothetical protein VGX76_00355 [Pirellulales bacterium]|nr:hypothetical protein [Pirellulales bacterium]
MAIVGGHFGAPIVAKLRGLRLPSGLGAKAVGDPRDVEEQRAFAELQHVAHLLAANGDDVATRKGLIDPLLVKLIDHKEPVLPKAP